MISPYPDLEHVDQIRDIAAELSADLKSAPGFAGIVMDLDASAVTVWWQGPAPSSIDPIASEARDDGISVSSAAARFSKQQLNAASDALIKLSIADKTPKLEYVEPQPDYSGLVATISKDTLEQAGLTLNSLASLLSRLVDVPVESVVGSPIIWQSRQNDSPPWQGGARIALDSVPSQCTSGFAAISLSTATGYILGAAHCKRDQQGNYVATGVRDGTGELIAGNAGIRVDTTLDSMIVDPSTSPATIGRVYGGPWDASSSHPNYSYHVGGSLAPTVGDVVCVSGSFVGERCNRTIRSVDIDTDCFGNPCHFFSYRTDAYDTYTTANGDSGAPVYILRADGRVGARGIHSAGINPVACPTWLAGNSCTSIGLAKDITEVEDRWAVKVEVD